MCWKLTFSKTLRVDEARGNEKGIRTAQRQLDRTNYQFKQEEQKLVSTFTMKLYR